MIINVFGKNWKCCSETCSKEIQWKEILSNHNSEYREKGIESK
jgi:hypothetical protein